MGFWVATVAAIVVAIFLAYAWVRWHSLRPANPNRTDPLSSLKVIVEIAAIFVAGIWAYDRFLRVEEPSLHTNFRAEVQLERDSVLRGPKCLLIAQARIENVGKTEFTVNGLKVRIWRAPDALIWGSLPARFINVDSLLEILDPLDSVVFHSGQPLAYRYPPGGSATYGLPWVLPEMPDSETVFVRLDFDINGFPGADFFFTWGKPCLRRSGTRPNMRLKLPGIRK